MDERLERIMSSTKQQLLEAIEAAPESVLEELLTLLQIRIQAASLSLPPLNPPPQPEDVPLWAIAEQIRNTVPPEEWSTLPSDLAINFDSYQERHHQP
jgi:hypothetical protein